MAEEPENLIVTLLRDIRAKLDEHDRRFDEHDRQFAELRKQIADWQQTTATGIGFAAHANVRAETIERELDDLKHRVERLEEVR